MPLTEHEIEFTTPTLDAQGRIVGRATGHARVFTEGLGHGVTLQLVAIPGGSYLMGSPPGPGYEDERPQHRVTVAPFLMGQFPVTQEQWQALMGQHITRFHGPRRPVDSVSWVGATHFCERLAARTGRPYRLPSEAQWEYACRASTQAPFGYGLTLTSDVANYNGVFVYAQEPSGVYRHQTLDVGSLPPNAWGLHDLHGNLWEWCADAWHADYTGAPSDERVWQGRGDEPYRVARGGSWHDVPDVCRSSTRLRYKASDGDEFMGFRVVLGMDEERHPAR